MLRSSRLYTTALRALHLTGLDAAGASWARGAGAIFMLHRVCPQDAVSSSGFAPNGILEITPEFLETVIRKVIESGYDLLTLDAAAQRLASGERHDRPFACFTFDDGYRDNRDHALPICRSYGVPITVYVPADYADGRGQMWWLTLEDVIRKTDHLACDVGGVHRQFRCDTPSAKSSAFAAIYWWLRTQPDDVVVAFVAELARRHGVDPFARCRELIMNWDELRAFAEDPLVTIGAHTLSHVALARLPEAEARREMVESITRIEAELGKPCRHFSYPYGDAGSAGEREFAIARDLGLATAVTTAKGMVDLPGRADPFALSRFSLNGDYQDERCLSVLLSGVPFAALNWFSISPRRMRASAGVSKAVG